MYDEKELHDLEKRCRELRQKIEDERAPIQPERMRAWMRATDAQLSKLIRVIIEAHPEECSKINLVDFDAFK